MSSQRGERAEGGAELAPGELVLQFRIKNEGELFVRSTFPQDRAIFGFPPAWTPVLILLVAPTAEFLMEQAPLVAGCAATCT